MSKGNTTPRQVLLLGRLMMILSGLGVLGSTAIAYWLADGLSLGVQIFGHLALPVSAAVFKLGYVVRLAAHHALGNLEAG